MSEVHRGPQDSEVSEVRKGPQGSKVSEVRKGPQGKVSEVRKGPQGSTVSEDPLVRQENAERKENAESVVPQVPREAPTSTWPGRCA